jgi:hypothetical protein
VAFHRLVFGQQGTDAFRFIERGATVGRHLQRGVEMMQRRAQVPGLDRPLAVGERERGLLQLLDLLLQRALDDVEHGDRLGDARVARRVRHRCAVQPIVQVRKALARWMRRRRPAPRRRARRTPPGAVAARWRTARPEQSASVGSSGSSSATIISAQS